MNNKYYLTVSQTRIYALDNPVGDAYGYGKPQMPVAAVALAASSFTAAAGTFAAAAAAGAVGSMVAAGAVMVGSALSIVGTITGNAKLAKIGAVLGIVGGLAGGMSMPGAETGASNAAGAAGNAADVAAGAAKEAAADVAGQAAGEAAKTSIVDLTGTETMPLQDAAQAMPASAPFQQASKTGMLGQAEKAAPPAAQSAIETAAKPLAENTLDAGASTKVGQTFNEAGAKVANATQGNAFDASKIIQGARDQANAVNDPGMFAKFQAWTKENPELAKMVMEGGKGMLGSLVTSPRDQAMIDFYNAQSDQINRRKLWGSGRTA